MALVVAIKASAEPFVCPIKRVDGSAIENGFDLSVEFAYETVQYLLDEGTE